MSSYEETLEAILAAGSDDLSVFGGRYRGGILLQQEPAEFATVVEKLRELRPDYSTMLELGAAGGGTARFLRDVLGISRVYVVDDNRHHHAVWRGQILPGAVEWIGNSRDPACEHQLTAWGERFDLIHVDAGHDYESVRADLYLTLPYLADGGVVMLHDVAEANPWPGPKQLRREILAGAHPVDEIAMFGERLGTSLVRLRGSGG